MSRRAQPRKRGTPARYRLRRKAPQFVCVVGARRLPDLQQRFATFEVVGVPRLRGWVEVLACCHVAQCRAPQYRWRQLTDKERAELLEWRKSRGYPWHSPPHRAGSTRVYHLSASCYEHGAYIGASLNRMQSFCEQLVATLTEHASVVYAGVSSLIITTRWFTRQRCS